MDLSFGIPHLLVWKTAVKVKMMLIGLLYVCYPVP